MTCLMCGSEEPKDFTVFSDSRLCDDCMSILNYWFKETFYDIKTRYKALNGSDMEEGEFIEAMEEYLNIMRYEREIVKDRRRNALGRQLTREVW